MKDSLSIREARKLVLLSQGLPPSRAGGSAIAATLAAIERLGYIQIDTISVVQRAHHHTLWSRNPRYRAAHLEQLLNDKQIFEYWSHAAAYLPMRDYRYSLPRKHAIASGQQSHWYERDTSLMNSVLRRIADEGPMMARDFEHTGKALGEWESKPAKRALEYLFMQGELMIASRRNFHKVYDLTERVLPDQLDTSVPTQDEYIRFLITRFLQANGLAQAADIAYLLKATRPLIAATLQEMVANAELRCILCGNTPYYAIPASLELLGKPLARSKLKILSPFDNLLIQRKRTRVLFDFDYLIECYLPAAKRRFGYFSLPLLWEGTLVARMDCKVEKKQAILQIIHLAIEPGQTRIDTFCLALAKELKSYLAFNSCQGVEVQRTSPASLKPVLQHNIDSVIHDTQ